MHCKSYSHFFSKKFQYICVSLNVNFNDTLTNDIVSFEQLGPGVIVDGGCTVLGEEWELQLVEINWKDVGQKDR